MHSVHIMYMRVHMHSAPVHPTFYVVYNKSVKLRNTSLNESEKLHKINERKVFASSLITYIFYTSDWLQLTRYENLYIPDLSRITCTHKTRDGH